MIGHRRETGFNVRLAASVVLAAAAIPQGSPQESMAELNERYSFPVSVGAIYRDLQAFGGFPSGFSFREIGAEIRVPLRAALSTVQPFVRAGTLSVLEAGSAGGSQFDHSQMWASLGLGYSTRFSKNFEIGIDAGGGIFQTSFPNLSPGTTVGELGYLAEAGARIGLVPSYNLAVDLRPAIRYSRSLGLLDDFDGLYFGLGFAVSWRFGQDPDAAAAAVRALRLETQKLPPAFAAMQSYYSTRPFAQVALVNGENTELRDLEVAFFQPGYMDAPTPSATLNSLAPRGRAEIGLLAAFNQEVFRTEGTVPLAGEIVVRYRYRGRPVEQRMPVSYEMLDRTAITWDDDRKVGAFITPADSALRNYSSYVATSLRGETLPQLNQALQAAAQVYSALSSFGLTYQADPSSPFVRAQAGAIAVDSVSLARATLARGTGDCDDLTVLFASILESMGHETGFITVPGHIYLAVNTKIPARDFREVHPDRSMTIVQGDRLWVPVEITLVGKQPFADAWRRGAELWKLYDTNTDKRGFYTTAAAQTVYRPVGLRETDLGLQYGSRSDLAAAYRSELARLGDFALSELAAQAAKSGDVREWNALGIAYAKYGRAKDAESAFSRALRVDASFTSAQVNLGNLAYLQKDYRRALGSWQGAIRALETQGKGKSTSAQMILVNMSMAYSALSDFTLARTSFERAAEIDPARVRDYAYLASVGAGSDSTGRAAEQSASILFLREE